MTAGLELREEDGRMIIDLVQFGGAAEQQGLADLLEGEIAGVIVEADRPSKQWFYFPALVLLGLIILLQRRRRSTAAPAPEVARQG